MTKENILKRLNLILENDFNTLYRFNRPHEALEEEIEALREAIKYIEQEPNEDCISREKLDKALYERFHEEDSPNNITDVRLGEVRNFIKSFPPANLQEPGIGYWIRVDKDKLKCSKCEIIHLIAQYPHGKIDWCPNCGTKMQENKEDHNNDGWCNTCEFKYLESECRGCAIYDEYGNLITLSNYKQEGEVE